jgi:hypothetical protein
MNEIAGKEKNFYRREPGAATPQPKKRFNRKERKGCKEKKRYLSELGAFAPWRENIRIREPSTSGKFKRHAMTNMLSLVFG